MDDATLDSLKTALAATPDNTKLLCVVVAELEKRRDRGALTQLLGSREVTGLTSDDERRVVARGYRCVGDSRRALHVLEGDAAETQLLRARLHLDLGDKQAAARDYEHAVTQNPTLEDLELKALIGARLREVVPKGGRPALRVISNDDTSTSDVARLLTPEPQKVTFADVGGLEEVKKQITRKIILPYKKPSMFQKFKRRSGGGILLYGPPGCGKTLLARATAGECDAAFFNVAISDVLDMYIGESERKLHAIFEKARSSAPAILFFDELEALAGKRQYSREGTSAKLVSQFLSEMDGFAQTNSGVLMLGATNVPWAIDSAFRRAGRFDRVLFVPPPDAVARHAILEGLLRDRPVADDVDAAQLAKRTSGFSGADLLNLVETAVDEAIEASLDRGDEVPVQKGHVGAAFDSVKPTTVEWLTTARNYARYANESGQYDDVLDFLRKHGKA